MRYHLFLLLLLLPLFAGCRTAAQEPAEPEVELDKELPYDMPQQMLIIYDCRSGFPEESDPNDPLCPRFQPAEYREQSPDPASADAEKKKGHNAEEIRELTGDELQLFGFS